MSLRETVLHARAGYNSSRVDAHTDLIARVPLVVESVMTVLSKHNEDRENVSIEAVLLRDIVLNILDSVDAFAAAGLLELSQVDAGVSIICSV